jgi:hypothetical protein
MRAARDDLTTRKSRDAPPGFVHAQDHVGLRPKQRNRSFLRHPAEDREPPYGAKSKARIPQADSHSADSVFRFCAVSPHSLRVCGRGTAIGRMRRSALLRRGGSVSGKDGRVGSLFKSRRSRLCARAVAG